MHSSGKIHEVKFDISARSLRATPHFHTINTITSKRNDTRSRISQRCVLACVVTRARMKSSQRSYWLYCQPRLARLGKPLGFKTHVYYPPLVNGPASLHVVCAASHGARKGNSSLT